MSVESSAPRSLVDQADQERRAGQYAAAQALLDQAQKLAHRPGTPPSQLLEVALAQGFLHHDNGDFASAEEAFQQVARLAQAPESSSEYPAARVRVQHGLAAVYRAQGRYRAAERELRDALDFAHTHLEPDAPELLLVLNQLGVTFKYSGKFAEAEDLYQQALTILEGTLGPEHPAAATIYHNLGGLAHARGDFAKAEPLARRAVAIREGAFGADHPAVAADRAALAPILDALGHHDEAKQLLEQVLRTYTACGDHYEIAVTLNNLGAIAYRRHDLIEARTLFHRALDIKEATLGREHPQLAPTLNNLGLVHQHLGDIVAAHATYARAITILEHTVEPTHPTLTICRNKHAALRQLTPPTEGPR